MATRPRGKRGIGRRGAGRGERRLFVDGTVAIHTIDFDGGARLAVDFSISVIVLVEMTIGALHSFFEVNVR